MPKSAGPKQWLLGTWRSNRDKSLRGWLWPLNPKKRKAQKRIFQRELGKLVMRYTHKRVYSEFDGAGSSESYRVAWGNNKCLLVVSGPKSCESCQLIHFTSESEYWVHAGKNIEYFHKVST